MDCGEIFFDFINMVDVVVNKIMIVIFVKFVIFILCEVYIYGKIDI